MESSADPNIQKVDDCAWLAAVEVLAQTLKDVGWENRAEFAYESAALLKAMAKPSRLRATHRFLALERLGMQDRAIEWGMKLSADELLIVLARMSIVDRSLSYSAAEVAALLGWKLADAENASQNGSLYAYRAAERLLFPAWQFEVNLASGSATIISSDLGSILGVIPDAAVPGLVRAVMTLECPMIPKISGKAVSPREHLIRGGSYRPVAAALIYFLNGSMNAYFAL